jgi:hypothetical protein
MHNFEPVAQAKPKSFRLNVSGRSSPICPRRHLATIPLHHRGRPTGSRIRQALSRGGRSRRDNRRRRVAECRAEQILETYYRVAILGIAHVACSTISLSTTRPTTSTAGGYRFSPCSCTCKIDLMSSIGDMASRRDRMVRHQRIAPNRVDQLPMEPYQSARDRSQCRARTTPSRPATHPASPGDAVSPPITAAVNRCQRLNFATPARYEFR